MAPVVETNPDIEQTDAATEFIESQTEKWEKLDAERGSGAGDDANDEAGEETEQDEVDDPDPEDDDSDDEHTESDTSSGDRDGDDDESDEDSDDSESDEHTDEDDSEDSDDEADADDDEDEDDDQDDDEETEDEDDGEGLSEDFTEAARRSNIPISLEDVKDPTARKLVQQKIRQMDAGYTRMAQQLTAFRKEQTESRAEARFRKDNPVEYVAEVISKLDDATWEKVNERLKKLGDDDGKEIFEQLVTGRRAKATQAVTEELSAGDRVAQRVAHVESLAARVAAKQGLPWDFAENAVERAILRLPEGKRDLTDAEIESVVTAAARQYHQHVRGQNRKKSRDTVRERTANRRASSNPGSKAPSSAASPKPGTSKPPKVDYNSEESRQDAMMSTARRLFKGAKDK